jgi:hypothetical protein
LVIRFSYRVGDKLVIVLVYFRLTAVREERVKFFRLRQSAVYVFVSHFFSFSLNGASV